jgi:hypothetical protein
MLVKSKLTSELYEDTESIRIPNQLQAYKYMINGLEPIDLIYTDRLVFVFNRAKSKDYFDKWCDHLL